MCAFNAIWRLSRKLQSFTPRGGESISNFLIPHPPRPVYLGIYVFVFMYLYDFSGFYPQFVNISCKLQLVALISEIKNYQTLTLFVLSICGDFGSEINEMTMDCQGSLKKKTRSNLGNCPKFAQTHPPQPIWESLTVIFLLQIWHL